MYMRYLVLAEKVEAEVIGSFGDWGMAVPFPGATRVMFALKPDYMRASFHSNAF
jgi:hypothetical protein